MPGSDDRLTRELERAARPAAPDPVRTFDDVVRRRAHRAVVRKAEVVAVVVAILVGTASAFVLLDDRLDGRDRPAGTPSPGLSGDASISMLQFRRVLATYAPDTVGTPQLTCLPSECSLQQTAADRGVVLAGPAGIVYELGPVVADGNDVTWAKVLDTTGFPGSANVSVVLDGEAHRAVATAGEPRALVAVVWRGEVVGRIGGPVTEEILLTVGSAEAAAALVSALELQAPAWGSPSPTGGDDGGIETRLCDVRSLDDLDLLGDGTPSSAWTGFAVGEDGTCPRDPDDQRWELAVDVTGDATADVAWGPLDGCQYTSCLPLGASDLDGDGDQELVVGRLFSIVDHLYFSLGADDQGSYFLDPILVAEPGNPAANIEPGEPLVTSAGGDEGYSSWMRCEGYPEEPVLVWTWSYRAVESDLPAEWHETKLRLETDGTFHVVATNDFELPAGEDPGLIRSGEPACGLRFDHWASPNPG